MLLKSNLEQQNLSDIRHILKITLIRSPVPANGPRFGVVTDSVRVAITVYLKIKNSLKSYIEFQGLHALLGDSFTSFSH